MKKICTFLFAIFISCGFAFAETTDIGANATSADCTEPTLGTYSGDANMEAKWTANTVQLRWYDGYSDTQITPTNTSANNCTYDSVLTIPDNPPERIGYNFAGWTVIPGLPAGYTKLQYIESTGTQYIDTGLKGTNDTVLETEIAFSDTSSPMLWGYNSNVGGNTDRISAYISIGGRCNFGNTSTDASLPRYITVGTFTTIKQNNTGIYIDGVKRLNYNATNTFTTAYNMYFLWANGTGASPTSGKVKWFKITRGGNVVMNLVPAKNSSGVIGMYDTVSGQFFTNQGTGEFVAGPAVTQ
jgi:hypothetical protein